MRKISFKVGEFENLKLQHDIDYLDCSCCNANPKDFLKIGTHRNYSEGIK